VHTMYRIVRYTDTEKAAAKNAVIMPRHEVDHVDLKLLVALQDNGRWTNVELSRFAGITAPPCLRRIRTLEERGIIRGYHADIDPKKLGFSVTAFVHVGLTSQTQRELEVFGKHLHSWRIVREAYALQGEVDFLLKCVARDLSELQSFLTDVLLATANVKHVKTSVLFNVVKKAASVPISL